MIWGEEQQKAFDQIKEALINPPILVPPMPGRPLKLYILAAKDFICYLLAQDDEDNVEKSIIYLNCLLNDAHTRYTPIEKLCLSLYHTCTKLEHYLLPREVKVLSKIDIVKYLLNRPVL